MLTNEMRRAVGLFGSREEAEAALYRLRDAGFNMDKVSIVARNADSRNDIVGAYTDQDKSEQIRGGAGAGAVAGAATGGLMGLFGSIGVLAIPGVGVAAEVGIVLANTLLGGSIGAAGGGLVGALIGWGVPEDRAEYYDTRVHQGDYLLMVEGTEPEIHSAEAALGSRGVRDWNVFGVPGTVGDRRVGPVNRY